MTNLLSRIRTNRMWLRLISHESLAHLLGVPCADPDLRARFLCESILRAWLFAAEFAPRQSTMRVLFEQVWRAHGIDHKTIDCISQWCSGQSKKRSFTLPVASLGMPVMHLVSHELDNWRHTNFIGVFVVKGANQHMLPAIALPCTVESLNRPNVCAVRTESDVPLRGLEYGVRTANSVARRLNIAKDKSHIVTVGGVWADMAEELPFEGESLGLALLVYLIRNAAQDPFALAASGALTRNGALDAQRNTSAIVQTKAALLKAIGVSKIILPALGQVPRGITRWPVAKVLDTQIAQLQRHFKTHTAASNLVDYAAELERIDSGMRCGTVPSADAKAALKPLVKQLDKRTDPHGLRYWAWAATLLASAECHQGNPHRSSQLCKMVLKRRNQVGTRCTAHALIRQAVTLTDMMEYEGAVRMCNEALEVIGMHSDDLERKDLEMQTYGTRAQALMYWGLQDESKRQPAWLDVNRAVAWARELHHPDNHSNDLARDLNYRYLWYACFEPTKGRGAFDEAHKASQNDKVSRAHLIRIRWYAAYRAHLLGKKVNWRAFEHELPDESIEDGWLHKLALKYRGALRADAGGIRYAEADFCRAVSLIHSSTKVLALLGATAALQAFISLRLHSPRHAKYYLSKAVPFLKPGSVSYAPMCIHGRSVHSPASSSCVCLTALAHCKRMPY